MINLFKSIKNYIKGIFLKSMDKQLTEVEKLNDRLKELFKLDEGFVVSLNGKWGVGKTHFWHNFVKENLSDKKTAYISLFGQESLKDIEKKIIFEISSKDKTISGLKDRVKDFKTTLGLKYDNSSFGITGSLLNIGLSLFEKKDFKDVIVCFDDFERMSDKIKLKDVLGLISELKEQKNCKVIMIFENHKIEDEKLFSEYKEKIIDYELKREEW
jgi:Cdc6-like AAA superfamily ATPase